MQVFICIFYTHSFPSHVVIVVTVCLFTTCKKKGGVETGNEAN